MIDAHTILLPLPEEPGDLRAETRALLEDRPGQGARLTSDAAFVADLLWEEWGEKLAGSEALGRGRALAETLRGRPGRTGAAQARGPRGRGFSEVNQ